MTDPEPVRIRLDWSQIASAAALHANQVVAQVGGPGTDGFPDGVFITLGSVPPPVLIEGDPQAGQALDELRKTGVRVNVLGQYHISRQLLADLISVLQVTAAKYDQAVQAAKSAKEGASNDADD